MMNQVTHTEGKHWLMNLTGQIKKNYKPTKKKEIMSQEIYGKVRWYLLLNWT